MASAVFRTGSDSRKTTIDVFRAQSANNVYFVATQFTILDYSFGWILFFSLGDKHNKTKVTSHSNDVHKLFIHVDISVLRCAAVG